MFDPQLVKLFGDGILETLYMTLVSTAISYLLGLPIGVLLTTSAPDGISPRPVLYRTLGVVVNILRSVPFLILMVCVLGLTRFLVGTTIGSTAVIPPLVIAAAPYVGRMVEGSLKEVDHGVIEAAQSMGASVFQIITRVLLPESTPFTPQRRGDSHHHHTFLLRHGGRAGGRRPWGHSHQLRLPPLPA